MENKVVESYLRKLQEDFVEQVDVGATMGGAALGIAIVLAVSKSIKYIATSKVCRNYKHGSPPWEICEKKVKIGNCKKQIAAINAKANLCNKSRQPEKCKAKLKEKVTKLQRQIKEQETRIKQLQPQVTK